jgi:hypothetical protein
MFLSHRQHEGALAAAVVDGEGGVHRKEL